jgi:hypothetical protein
VAGDSGDRREGTDWSWAVIRLGELPIVTFGSAVSMAWLGVVVVEEG